MVILLYVCLCFQPVKCQKQFDERSVQELSFVEVPAGFYTSFRQGLTCFWHQIKGRTNSNVWLELASFRAVWSEDSISYRVMFPKQVYLWGAVDATAKWLCMILSCMIWFPCVCLPHLYSARCFGRTILLNVLSYFFKRVSLHFLSLMPWLGDVSPHVSVVLTFLIPHFYHLLSTVFIL